jgi:hypothetical protein
MSFTESEELNKWIHRSYEIGKREERERIIKLLEEFDGLIGDSKRIIALIKGEPYECECDLCSDKSCSCRKKCDFCVKQDEDR